MKKAHLSVGFLLGASSDHICSIITCKSGCSPRRIRPCPLALRKHPPISPYYMWDVMGCSGTIALARLGSRHFVRSDFTVALPWLGQGQQSRC